MHWSWIYSSQEEECDKCVCELNKRHKYSPPSILFFENRSFKVHAKLDHDVFIVIDKIKIRKQKFCLLLPEIIWCYNEVNQAKLSLIEFSLYFFLHNRRTTFRKLCVQLSFSNSQRKQNKTAQTNLYNRKNYYRNFLRVRFSLLDYCSKNFYLKTLNRPGPKGVVGNRESFPIF